MASYSVRILPSFFSDIHYVCPLINQRVLIIRFVLDKSGITIVNSDISRTESNGGLESIVSSVKDVGLGMITFGRTVFVGFAISEATDGFLFLILIVDRSPDEEII